MNYIKRVYAGANPVELMKDTFIRIQAWFTMGRLSTNEAEYLADMTRKVDWDDQYERDDFVQLTRYFSSRSSISEDLSWGEVVGLD